MQLNGIRFHGRAGVGGFAEQGVADEGARHAAGAEPIRFEGQQAHDVVGQLAQPPDAPLGPGPQLGGHEVNNGRVGSHLAGGTAHGPVGGGAVDGHVTGDVVLVQPAGEVGLAPQQRLTFGGDGHPHAHLGVAGGFFEQFTAGGLHLGAAEADEGLLRVTALEFADEPGGEHVRAGLEGGKDDGFAGG